MKDEKTINERNWKEFTGTPSHSGNGLYASINHKGLIVLNRLAFDTLGRPGSVLLFFDGDNGLIGLKACDQKMPNAFPLFLRGRSGTRGVTVSAFCKENQIEPTGTIRFLNPEMEKDILVLDLNHTVRATQSPRKGWRKKS